MNFCTEALGTRIEVLEKVAEEGYEVTNLLRSNQQLQLSFNGHVNNHGFMSARFIRAPVTIRLDFPIPIHISHVVLSTKLGQQISTGFKIQTQINSSIGKRDDALHQIGREILTGPTFPETVVFRNPRFLLHRKFHSLPLEKFESSQKFLNIYELRHPTNNACERVFSLHITIERTHRISLPVLGSLAVWGQPSKWTSPQQIRNLINNWLGSLGSIASAKRKLTEEATDSGNSERAIKRRRLNSPSNENHSDLLEIPEEFLDPITFEVICQPIRLPSGMAVDAKTLEKYSKEEAVWGRPANDPFTGKTFTDTSHPLPDFSLKARIDSFLTRHSNDSTVKTLPRTIGTIKSHPNSIPSPETSFPSLSLPQDTPYRDDINRKERTAASSNDGFLDEELARILGKTSSSKSENTENVSEVLRKCFHCDVTPQHQIQGLHFYKTDCNHTMVCRNCLIIIDKMILRFCDVCHSKWSTKELSRTFI